MKKLKTSLLTKIFTTLFLTAPLVLFFSYYPIISFGTTDSMNLELSLPLIWLVLYDICAAVLCLKEYRKFVKLAPKFFLYCLFPIYMTVSIIWSPNFLRGFLTAGVIWLIFIAIYFSYRLQHLLRPQKSNLIKSIFASAIVISIWCWVQSILDLVGLDRSQTLMCNGCITATFGFPHPNGFAVEPQFMGNLLLAPTLLAVFCWYQKPNAKHLAILLFLSATLFFTFSRGAIYAFGLAIILMLTLLIIKQKSTRPLLVLPVLLFSFIFSLNAQGLMAAASSTNDTYLTGIAKSIDQLTLGIFNLRIEQSEPEPSEPEFKPISETESSDSNSTYGGYVEVSTTGRLEIASSSLKVWSSSLTNFLFGVGLGGSGQALYQAGELGSPAEIGQNEYCTILLEFGIIGTILLAITIIAAFRTLLISLDYRSLLFALILAYAVSIFFFSGITNALHLYLSPAFWMSFTPKRYQK